MSTYLPENDDLKHQKCQVIAPCECNTSKTFLTSCCVVWILSGILVLTEITFSIYMYRGTRVRFQLTEQLCSAIVLFNTEYVLQSSRPTLAVLFSGCPASIILLIRTKFDSRGLTAVISWCKDSLPCLSSRHLDPEYFWKWGIFSVALWSLFSHEISICS
jgi:hypothetical protein